MLGDAVESVLMQGDLISQVIVIDDHSTVPMMLTDLGIKDKKVILTRNSTNLGLAISRNIGISKVKTRYFSFLDDDDIWSAGIANRMLCSIRESECDAACELHIDHLHSGLAGRPISFSEIFARGITPPVGAQLYDMKAIREVGGYNNSISSGVDHDLWVKLLERGSHLAISIGPGSRINSKAKINDRMTTRINERIFGINKSLEIWRPLIVSTMNKKFFIHFKERYQLYILWIAFSQIDNTNIKLRFVIHHPKIIKAIIFKLYIKITKRTFFEFSSDKLRS